MQLSCWGVRLLPLVMQKMQFVNQAGRHVLYHCQSGRQADRQAGWLAGKQAGSVSVCLFCLSVCLSVYLTEGFARRQPGMQYGDLFEICALKQCYNLFTTQRWSPTIVFVVKIRSPPNKSLATMAAMDLCRDHS